MSHVYEASVEATPQIPRPSLLDCLATATAAMFSSEMEYDHTLGKFKWKQIQMAHGEEEKPIKRLILIKLFSSWPWLHEHEATHQQY